jgi:hypothetical protein
MTEVESMRLDHASAAASLSAAHPATAGSARSQVVPGKRSAAAAIPQPRVAAMHAQKIAPASLVLKGLIGMVRERCKVRFDAPPTPLIKN